MLRSALIIFKNFNLQALLIEIEQWKANLKLLSLKYTKLLAINIWSRQMIILVTGKD